MRFAIIAAPCALTRVTDTQMTSSLRSGRPRSMKWLTAPMSAVNVMMQTLVPTDFLNSLPRRTLRTKSIMSPPPAPWKPQTKPM